MHASRGAISGTVRLLESAGFIRRSRRRGDRNEYFGAPPEAFHRLIQRSGGTYRRIREIVEHGLGTLTDLPPPRRDRLEEVHAFMAFVEGELPALLDRYVQERAGSTEITVTNT
jgi:DNA-binding transcriptional regulator GbsR (MarR family)